MQRNVYGQVQLSYPPPKVCAKGGEPCEPFASREGWLCWRCLPESDRRNADGVIVPEPRLDDRDFADLQDIRERLDPHAIRCSVCGEPTPDRELYQRNGAWVCKRCVTKQEKNRPSLPLENTGLSGHSEGRNAPGSTIDEGALPEDPLRAEGRLGGRAA